MGGSGQMPTRTGARHGPQGGRARAQSARRGTWLPYVLVVVLICLGPARPLLQQLLHEFLPRGLEGLVGGRGNEPIPWYDAVE